MPSRRSRTVSLLRIAERQHGLFTARQARVLGFTYAALAKRASAGHVVRVHHGVYALGRGPDTQEARCLAATLAAGPGSALTGMCAIDLWDVSRWPAGSIVVVGARSRRTSSGSDLRATPIAAVDTAQRCGIRVARVERALVDLAQDLTVHQLAWTINEARFRNCIRLRRLRELIESRTNLPGRARLVAALQLHLDGCPGTRSALEDRFLEHARRGGAPVPLVNMPIDGIEVDMHWPGSDLCIELDGGGHSRPSQRRIDQARDRRLGELGYRVIRIRWRELDERAPHVIAEATRRTLNAG